MDATYEILRGLLPAIDGWPSWLVTVLIALLPAPQGLPQFAWYYFAIFAGVIVGLMVEPLPGGAIGLIGVTAVAVLAPYVLFAPAELAKPGFKSANAALTWALSGFSNGTVWLIFGAFMFALGYETTGLGRRIALMLVKVMGRRTLTLGYAVVFADALLAPFTPSNTARSGGTIYPIVRQIPALYGSEPGPTARRIGGYLMWTAFAATAVTSSMFITALVPNATALALAERTMDFELGWWGFFAGFAPAGLLLLALVPLVTYWVYPPEVRDSPETVVWAADQLRQMGPVSRREWTMAALVPLAMLCIYGLGLMGVISPYATGCAPIYAGSGFIGRGRFWMLGLLFGAMFFVVLVGVAGPWVMGPMARR